MKEFLIYILQVYMSISSINKGKNILPEVNISNGHMNNACSNPLIAKTENSNKQSEDFFVELDQNEIQKKFCHNLKNKIESANEKKCKNDVDDNSILKTIKESDDNHKDKKKRKKKNRSNKKINESEIQNPQKKDILDTELNCSRKIITCDKKENEFEDKSNKIAQLESQIKNIVEKIKFQIINISSSILNDINKVEDYDNASDVVHDTSKNKTKKISDDANHLISNNQNKEKNEKFYYDDNLKSGDNRNKDLNEILDVNKLNDETISTAKKVIDNVIEPTHKDIKSIENTSNKNDLSKKSTGQNLNKVRFAEKVKFVFYEKDVKKKQEVIKIQDDMKATVLSKCQNLYEQKESKEGSNSANIVEESENAEKILKCDNLKEFNANKYDNVNNSLNKEIEENVILDSTLRKRDNNNKINKLPKLNTQKDKKGHKTRSDKVIKLKNENTINVSPVMDSKLSKNQLKKKSKQCSNVDAQKIKISNDDVISHESNEQSSLLIKKLNKKIKKLPEKCEDQDTKQIVVNKCNKKMDTNNYENEPVRSHDNFEYDSEKNNISPQILNLDEKNEDQHKIIQQNSNSDDKNEVQDKIIKQKSNSDEKNEKQDKSTQQNSKSVKKNKDQNKIIKQNSNSNEKNIVQDKITQQNFNSDEKNKKQDLITQQNFIADAKIEQSKDQSNDVEIKSPSDNREVIDNKVEKKVELESITKLVKSQENIYNETTNIQSTENSKHQQENLKISTKSEKDNNEPYQSNYNIEKLEKLKNSQIREIEIKNSTTQPISSSEEQNERNKAFCCKYKDEKIQDNMQTIIFNNARGQNKFEISEIRDSKNIDQNSQLLNALEFRGINHIRTNSSNDNSPIYKQENAMLISNSQEGSSQYSYNNPIFFPHSANNISLDQNIQKLHVNNNFYGSNQQVDILNTNSQRYNAPYMNNNEGRTIFYQNNHEFDLINTTENVNFGQNQDFYMNNPFYEGQNNFNYPENNPNNVFSGNFYNCNPNNESNIHYPYTYNEYHHMPVFFLPHYNHSNYSDQRNNFENYHAPLIHYFPDHIPVHYNNLIYIYPNLYNNQSSSNYSFEGNNEKIKYETKSSAKSYKCNRNKSYVKKFCTEKTITVENGSTDRFGKRQKIEKKVKVELKVTVTP